VPTATAAAGRLDCTPRTHVRTHAHIDPEGDVESTLRLANTRDPWYFKQVPASWRFGGRVPKKVVAEKEWSCRRRVGRLVVDGQSLPARGHPTSTTTHVWVGKEKAHYHRFLVEWWILCLQRG